MSRSYDSHRNRFRQPLKDIEMLYRLFSALLLVIVLPLPSVTADEPFGPSVKFNRSAVNSVLISSGDRNLAVYGVGQRDTKQQDAKYEQLLLTHHRRDVLGDAIGALPVGTSIIAPEAERVWLEKPIEFWNAFTKNRFHDYGCFTTKIVAQPVKVERWMKEADAIQWRGLKFEVIDTPGYTPGAISYLTTIDGKKLAFTGDLIYGDGQLFDLYSFQEAIPEASIRGYHGYAGRLAQLVTSLRKISALQPDIIVPARGPLIENPQAAIDKLIGRVQALYANYLSTNALHWYFKEDRMRQCGERILGKGAKIELMPYSHHEKAPDWVFENATSRLLISDEGHGFLLDCGYQRVIDAVQKLIDSGLVKKVDGIFVTHYHDDHTDMVQEAAEQFKCPVYATQEYVDILQNPAAYHMPAMTSTPIKNIKSLASGHVMKWHEFELTFHSFPGQAFYHGALLVRKGNERPVFFIGDSFAPSGIDDYCLQNRNLVHDDGGYNLCFKTLRDIQQPHWLVNEHIPFVFQFTDAEMTYLESRYRQRTRILKELFPWDAPNYGIDEQWAVFYPYGATTTASRAIALEVHITNHSPAGREFTVTPNLPAGMKLVSSQAKIQLEPGQLGKVRMSVNVGTNVGNHLITADVSSEGMEFRDWIEALITVE